jgi:hypothetical protein
MADNGFWDVTEGTLETISQTIADRFDLSVTEAGS